MNENDDERTFNSVSGVSKPPRELIQLDILRQKFYLMESLEAYYLRKAKHFETQPAIVSMSARTKRLIMELKQPYIRHYKEEGFAELCKLANGNESELLEAIQKIIDYLDYIKLTRIDVDNYNNLHTDIKDNLEDL
jgi:hypothetical protein